MEKVYGYKPIMYYTNGYSTKIIDGIYPDRSVVAFHTLDELELMLQRRLRGNITDMKVNEENTNRPYQKMAITSICEWLNQNHRRGLLVMATGTGKTRVAISLVDVLTRNKWVKNVLFLADRTSLVNQAKRNFAKLMPNMSVCELSAPGEKDYNARLMFCTYQTMINYIDAEDKSFSTGRFDLIIIDEAHRSIFNRYGTIFKYFDSFLVGLTATPKNEVDANTYNIFGCEAGIPNFDYSLEEAIKDKYLVGYHAINRTSKLLTEGIKYSELTDEQKAQLEEYLEEEPPKLSSINGGFNWNDGVAEDPFGTNYSGVCNFVVFYGDSCHWHYTTSAEYKLSGAYTSTLCVVFSNYNHKVKGTYEWIKYLPYIRYVETVEEAETAIPELLKMKDCRFDNSPLIPYFDKLAKVVREKCQR